MSVPTSAFRVTATAATLVVPTLETPRLVLVEILRLLLNESALVRTRLEVASLIKIVSLIIGVSLIKIAETGLTLIPGVTPPLDLRGPGNRGALGLGKLQRTLLEVLDLRISVPSTFAGTRCLGVLIALLKPAAALKLVRHIRGVIANNHLAVLRGCASIAKRCLSLELLIGLALNRGSRFQPIKPVTMHFCREVAL